MELQGFRIRLTTCNTFGSIGAVDISFMLEEFMDEQYDTLIEDNSTSELGMVLIEMSDKWLHGDFDFVDRYVKTLPNPSDIRDNFNPHMNIPMVNGVATGSEQVQLIKEECGKASNKSAVDVDDLGWQIVKRK